MNVLIFLFDFFNFFSYDFFTLLPPRGGGVEFIQLVRNIKFRREGNIKALGKNISWKEISSFIFIKAIRDIGSLDENQVIGNYIQYIPVFCLDYPVWVEWSQLLRRGKGRDRDLTEISELPKFRETFRSVLVKPFA